nr:MAG TPA: hypothetical protein [Bacteriophage sp.]
MLNYFGTIIKILSRNGSIHHQNIMIVCLFVIVSKIWLLLLNICI